MPSHFLRVHYPEARNQNRWTCYYLPYFQLSTLNSQSKVKSQLDLTMDLRVETLMLLVKLSHTWNLPDGPEHLEK